MDFRTTNITQLLTYFQNQTTKRRKMTRTMTTKMMVSKTKVQLQKKNQCAQRTSSRRTSSQRRIGLKTQRMIRIHLQHQKVIRTSVIRKLLKLSKKVRQTINRCYRTDCFMSCYKPLPIRKDVTRSFVLFQNLRKLQKQTHTRNT